MGSRLERKSWKLGSFQGEDSRRSMGWGWGGGWPQRFWKLYLLGSGLHGVQKGGEEREARRKNKEKKEGNRYRTSHPG